MASIIEFLLDKVAVPVGTGAGGVVLTVWRLQKSLADRLKSLEDAWKLFKDVDTPRERTELSARLTQLRRDLEHDLGESFGRARTRDRTDTSRLYSRLAQRLTALESRMDTCEKAVAELNDQYQAFAREQNDQWQTMTRTLGQLEGYLKGIFRNHGSSDGFPSLKK